MPAVAAGSEGERGRSCIHFVTSKQNFLLKQFEKELRFLGISTHEMITADFAEKTEEEIHKNLFRELRAVLISQGTKRIWGESQATIFLLAYIFLKIL